MNWTSAARLYTGALVRITSIEDLCKAQTALPDMNVSYGYWTALKLNSMGVYQWGHLAKNRANVAKELLDKTQPLDRCYVITKSWMKLLSKDCNSLQGVLTSYPCNNCGEQRISSSHQKRIYLTCWSWGA